MVSRVELLLTDQNGDKHYVDLENTNVGINMNYSIDDVRNIEKKNGNFSKTFTVPGTKNNNKIFGHLFDINTDFTQYNPNLRVDAVLLQDSSPLIEGYLQLKSVKKLNNTDLQGNLIKYDIILYDSSIDFFQKLGDKELTDLDISSYDHIFDKTTIENAWTASTYLDLYQYPLLDKDTFGYEHNDFKPSFYSKGLLIKIAEENGYALEGDFMDNDTLFDKELINWDGNEPEITKSEASSREFRAGMSASSVTIDSGTKNEFKTVYNDFFPRKVFDYDNVVFDNSGNYIPTDSIGGNPASTWEAPKTGKYSFTIKQKFTVTYTSSNACTMKSSFTGTVISNANGPLAIIKLYLRYEDDNSLISSSSKTLGRFQNFIGSGGTKNIINDLEFNTTVKVESGRKIYIEYKLDSDKSFAWLTSPSLSTIENVTIDFKANKVLSNGLDSTFFNKTVLVQEVEYGDTIDLGLYLPKGIKQRDFISDIIKRYNIYIRPNTDKIRTLILETRDVFYSNTEVLDWTQKKDYSSEDQISFLTELQNKEILFSYKPDNSYASVDNKKWNEIYTRNTGDIYGQKKVTFDNDFVKGTKKIESIFSSTPLLYRDVNGVVVPSIGSVNSKRNPVVTYWGGMVNVKDEDGIDKTDLLEIDWNGTTQVYDQYPYSGHYDNPYNPTIDIHFSEVTYEYYGILINQITDNNLFNRYWRNYIEQISGGKLVTSYFRLTETDINKIKDNLSPRIFVKDSYYVINKIVDYKPLEEGLTKVELLRIEKGSTFEPTISNTDNLTNIGTRVINADLFTTNQIFRGPFKSDVRNEVYTRDLVVLGSDNYVNEYSNGIIAGENNNVGGSINNFGIIGDNNIIDAGLENVFIVGNNQNILDSNTSYINGVVIKDSTITEIDRTGLWLFNNTDESILSYNSVAPHSITSGSQYSIIAGGVQSSLTGNFSSIIGGTTNILNQNSSTVIAGGQNNLDADQSSIISGVNNSITSVLSNSSASTIIAGANNTLETQYSGIFVGRNNTLNSLDSAIIAGKFNTLNNTATDSVILGGSNITGSLNQTVYVPSLSFGNEGVKWKFIELEIGDWNMDTTGSITLAHSLSNTERKTIRQLSLIIRDDLDSTYYNTTDGTSATVNASIDSIDINNLNLSRLASGIFDSTDFDSTGYNRGFVTFWYQPD